VWPLRDLRGQRRTAGTSQAAAASLRPGMVRLQPTAGVRRGGQAWTGAQISEEEAASRLHHGAGARRRDHGQKESMAAPGRQSHSSRPT
jgi:hypothetical protein